MTYSMPQNKSRRSLSNFLFLALLVFYFYNVKFTFLPVSSFVWAPALISLIYFYYFLRGYTAVSREYLLILFSFLIFEILAVSSIFANIVHFEVNVLRVLLVLFVAVFVFPNVLARYFEFDPVRAFKYIGLVGLVNSLFIILMFVFPSVKALWLSIIESLIERHLGDIDTSESMMSLRMIGINGFSAYSTSFLQITFAMFYMVYIYIGFKKISMCSILVVALIVASAFLAGRTTWVLFPFFSLFFVLLFGVWGFVKFAFFGAAVSVIFLMSFLVLADTVFVDFFLSWLFEVFSSGERVGSLGTNIDMLFSYSLIDFGLLGDFRLRADDGGYYMHTDVGYYRLLFAFGWLGTLAFFLLIFSPALRGRYVFKSNEYPGLLLCCFLICMVLVVSFKGAILLDSFPVVSLIIFSGVCRRYCRPIDTYLN